LWYIKAMAQGSITKLWYCPRQKLTNAALHILY
jgi:hypothetical protein